MLTEWLRRVVLLAAVGTLVGVFVGCNTVAGVGEDVQAVGEGITDIADGDEEE